MRFIAFDVETPNYANSRMSSIGLCVIEDGSIREEYYTLINPEQPFDRFNIQLTGITPDMVRKAPTFPEAWETLRPYMDSGLLVAHNAPFDMRVLGKCLQGYSIQWRDVASYACTVRLSRALSPELADHRLDTMSRFVGVNLHHHQADSDSRACGEILLYYLRQGANISDFIRNYDLKLLKTISVKRPKKP